MRSRGTPGKSPSEIDPIGAPKHVDFPGLRHDGYASQRTPYTEVGKILSQNDAPATKLMLSYPCIISEKEEM